jgi:hypothetical protein
MVYRGFRLACGAALAAIVVALGAVRAAPESDAVLRTIDVAVTDASGAAVSGLVPEEIVVLENGVARDVASAKEDERPLNLLVLVDSSRMIGSSFRLHVVPAVGEFLGRLPRSTRYTLWTTGDRPEKRVGPTGDPALGYRSLERVHPQGGNTMLDALVEASRELEVAEGERSAVVAVSGMGIEFSNRERRQIVELAAPNAEEFSIVHFREGDADSQMQANYGFVFDGLTRRTDGVYETPLSVMGVASALESLSADIHGRYRIRYATLLEIEAQEVKVEVARPGVQGRVIRTSDEDSVQSAEESAKAE